MYVEGEGDAKSALNQLEGARAYFLGVTHSKDPGGQSVRVVAFKSESDFTKYRPNEFGAARIYTQQGASPATIVLLGLNPNAYEQVFREYAQLVLDESAPTLPYWFRTGMAEVYSTVKPGEGTVKLGAAPYRGFKSGGVGDGADLSALVTIDRAGIISSRGKQRADFYTDSTSSKTLSALGNGAATSALAQVESGVTTDYATVAWMLTHMIMFHADYRPKFGEFLNTLGSGVETGSAFSKVYGRSLTQVANDLLLYAKQPSLAVATLKFAGPTIAAPQIKAATKDEEDRILADLSRKK